MDNIEFTSYTDEPKLQSAYASGFFDSRSPEQRQIDDLKQRVTALEAKKRWQNPFKGILNKLRSKFECQREHIEDYYDDY